MRLSKRFAMVLGLSAMLAQACTVPFNLQPRVVAVPDGTWSGTTNRGGVITFTVKGHVVTELTLTYHLTGCPVETTESVTPSVTLAPALGGNGMFRYDYQSASSVANISLAGYFDTASPPKASGSVDITKTNCPGSNLAPWNATKQ